MLQLVFEQVLATRSWKFAARLAQVCVAAREAVDAWRSMETTASLRLSGVDDHGLAAMARSCSRLSMLEIDMVTASCTAVCQIIQACTLLQRLSLNSCSTTARDCHAALATAAEHLSNLKHLRVETMDWHECLVTNAIGPHIQFSDMENVSREARFVSRGVSLVIKECKTLDSLDVRDAAFEPGQVLNALAKERRNLTSLHLPLNYDLPWLRQCSEPFQRAYEAFTVIRGSVLRRVFKCCTRLEALTMDRLNLEAAQALGASCPHLRVLELSVIGDKVQSLGSSAMAMDAIVSGCPSLEEVYLRQVCGPDGSFVAGAAVRRALAGSRHLQKISFRTIQTSEWFYYPAETEDDKAALRELLTGCEHLTELVLEHGYHDGLVEAVATSRPALCSLHLKDTCVSDAELAVVAEHCTSLRSLRVVEHQAELRDVSSAGLIAIAQRCPDLQAVQISRQGEDGMAGVDDDALQALMDGCPLLTKVDFIASDATDDGLVAFATACGPRLKALGLSSMDHLDGATFEHVARHCPLLTYLDLSYTSATDAALIALAEMPESQMATLSLESCVRVNVDGIRSLAKLPCLQRVNFHGLREGPLEWLRAHAQNRALQVITEEGELFSDIFVA